MECRGTPAARAEVDPLASLLTMARGHVLYCRRDVARVMLTLRIEFAGQDHPVGRTVDESIGQLEAECAELIAAGRRNGSILPGPPARLTAAAFAGVFEAVAIEVAGQAPHDIELMERAVRGVLGIAPIGSPSPTTHH